MHHHDEGAFRVPKFACPDKAGGGTSSRSDVVGEAHQALTNFLHYQSHVQFAAAASLPPHVSPADDNERKEIIRLLKNEARTLNTLERLIAAIRANDKELLETYTRSLPSPTHSLRSP